MDSYKRSLIVVALVIFLVVMAITGFSLRRRPVVEQQAINNNVQSPLDSSCETIDQKQYCSADYTSLSEQQATDKAKSDGLSTRVVENNKNPVGAITDDIQPKRINFYIRDDIVYKAEFF
ncbi:MAG: hypothetical protein M3Q36_00900 [bacterium]|nr:hypothetical protein [bacterium]